MDPKILASLRIILAKLYPDEASIRRIIDDSRVDLLRIRLDSTPINNWHSVLIEAEKINCVDTLLDVVNAEYGNNKEFQKALVNYRQAAGSQADDRNSDQNFDGFLPSIARKYHLNYLVAIMVVLIAYNFIMPEVREPIIFEVAAYLSWQPTKVQISNGERVKITYITGKWRLGDEATLTDPTGSEPGPDHIPADPECLFSINQSDAGLNALIAKIGDDGHPFNPFKSSPTGEGMLYLRANDCDKHLGDNYGSVIIQIELIH